MKVLITGATGMIGGIILEKCLADESITEIVTIGRKLLGIQSTKITEIKWADFLNFIGLEKEFQNVEVAYYCIGVYTGTVSDDKFKEITVDYTKSFADMLKQESPHSTCAFLSGAGADPKEKSRTSFARYKGMAENYLIQKNFNELFIFRPGYIYPVKKRKEPNFWYGIFRVMYPLMKLFGKNVSVKSTQLAEAMFKLAKKSPAKSILENRDILAFLH